MFNQGLKNKYNGNKRILIPALFVFVIQQGAASSFFWTKF